MVPHLPLLPDNPLPLLLDLHCPCHLRLARLLPHLRNPAKLLELLELVVAASPASKQPEERRGTVGFEWFARHSRAALRTAGKHTVGRSWSGHVCEIPANNIRLNRLSRVVLVLEARGMHLLNNQAKQS